MTEITNAPPSREQERNTPLYLDRLTGFEGLQKRMATHALSQFNPAILKENLATLKAINPKDIQVVDEETTQSMQATVANCITAIELQIKRFGPMLNTLQSMSSPIESTLASTLGNKSGKLTTTATTSEQAQNATRKSLAQPGNHLLLTDSHVSTHYLLEELKRQGTSNVGLVVFDNHIDLYTTFGFQYDKPAKQLFLGLGLRSDPTLRVAVLGPSANHIQEMAKTTAGTLTPDEISRTQLLHVKTPSFLEKGRQDQKIKDLMGWFKQSGTEHILLSVDIDVLIEGYGQQDLITACEYSRLNFLVPMGSYRIADIVRSAKSFSPSTASLNEPSQVAKALRMGRIFDFDNQGKKINSSSLEISGLKGQFAEAGKVDLKTLTDWLGLVKAETSRQGMEFGVSLQSNRRVIGDINELIGNDYNGNTANAVKEIITAMK